MRSTEFLALIAKNDLVIVVEKAFPQGKLKRDVISLHTRDGRMASHNDPRGLKGPVHLSQAILDDFLRASFVTVLEDGEGRMVYELTPDGRERGLS